MKRSRILAGALLAGGLWAGSAMAQAPAGGGAGAAPAQGAQAAGKPGFCERLEAGIDRKKRKLCATPLGQMLNSITKPASIATGGIIPGFCPAKPSEEELKKPGAAGAAAQAKKDAVEAAERRAAVRLLGTFDCHWHPEAEAGLVAALRTDRAECVRLEAAIALNRGCCCTRAIVLALEDCVGGLEKFGPYENSPRVQAIAMMALERCLQCPEANMIEAEPIKPEEKKEEKEGEPVPAPRKADDPGQAKPMAPAAAPTAPSIIPVTARGSGKPSGQELNHARQTLVVAKSRMMNTPASGNLVLPTGQRSLAGIANYVANGKPRTVEAKVDAKSEEAPPKAPVNVAKPAAPARPAAQPAAKSPAKSLPAEVVAAEHAKVETPAKSRAIDPKVLRCLETLRDADDPEVRHSAVRTLVACNWRENPEAVAGVLYGARYDKHSGMRVACIRSLVAMKCATPEVLAGLKPMLNDSDDWIRNETAQALAHLENASVQK